MIVTVDLRQETAVRREKDSHGLCLLTQLGHFLIMCVYYRFQKK